MDQDQNFRSDESDDDYDSEQEETEVRSLMHRHNKWILSDRGLWPQSRPADDSACESDDSYDNPFRKHSDPSSVKGGLYDLGDL